MEPLVDELLLHSVSGDESFLDGLHADLVLRAPFSIFTVHHPGVDELGLELLGGVDTIGGELLADLVGSAHLSTNLEVDGDFLPVFFGDDFVVLEGSVSFGGILLESGFSFGSFSFNIIHPVQVLEGRWVEPLVDKFLLDGVSGDESFLDSLHADLVLGAPFSVLSVHHPGVDELGLELLGSVDTVGGELLADLVGSAFLSTNVEEDGSFLPVLLCISSDDGSVLLDGGFSAVKSSVSFS